MTYGVYFISKFSNRKTKTMEGAVNQGVQIAYQVEFDNI